MRIASPGHAIFAATLIAIGLMGFVSGDFGAIWQPVGKGVPAREALVYLCALVALGCGIGLLVQRAAGPAARVLLAYLLLWMMLSKGRAIVLEPGAPVSWESLAESLVLVAAAWVLFAWFAADAHRPRLRFTSGDRGLRIARAIYGLAMIAFGVAHFAYPTQTAALVPNWLPAHLAWTYFTGAAYIAAGVAMLVGVYARLAASLSALQMAVFTLLVWAPFVVAGPNASEWSEFVVSCALTAGGWVVADSYRGTAWLATARSRA